MYIGFLLLLEAVMGFYNEYRQGQRSFAFFFLIIENIKWGR